MTTAPDSTTPDSTVEEDALEWERMVDVALAQRPAVAADVAQVVLPGGTLVWGAEPAPILLPRPASTLWDYLDGETTLGDLAEDLAFAAPVKRTVARSYVARFALDLASTSVITGVDGLRDALPPEPPAPERPAEREEVVDGVRYMVSEFQVSTESIGRITGGAASLGDLVPEDSCSGRRLQLDRPGEFVSIPMDFGPVAIRSTDVGVLEWLRQFAGPTEARGPGIGFVTVDASGPDAPRFAVYDHQLYLVCATSDRKAVEDCLLAMLTNHMTLRPPETAVELTAHPVVKGDRVILASIGSLNRPRGLIRRMNRAGMRLEPTRRAFVTPDLDAVWVPVLSGRPDDAEALRWTRYRLVGSWVGGKEAGDISIAELAMIVLRNATENTHAHRQSALDLWGSLLQTRPFRVGFESDSSGGGVVRALTELFEQPASKA